MADDLTPELSELMLWCAKIHQRLRKTQKTHIVLLGFAVVGMEVKGLGDGADFPMLGEEPMPDVSARFFINHGATSSHKRRG